MDGPEQVEAMLRRFGPPPGKPDARLAREVVRAGLFPNRGPVLAGKYELAAQIGRGGLGTVYRARDTELERDVALKFLHEVEADVSIHLLHEARSLARLAHPNVVVVHEVVAESSQGPFIAMEYVAGISLASWLEQPRRWRDVLAMFVQATAGLSNAHDGGVIHGDFKPANVLVGNDGRVRVADFGLACATSGEAGNPTPSTRSVRGGTLGYVAPEQLAGQRDERSDIFSVCVSLYEGVFGVRPFEANSVDAYIEAIRCGQTRAPVEPRDVPRWLRRAIAKGLRFEPSERFTSMPQLVHALRPPRVGRAVFASTLVVVAVGLGASPWLGVSHEPIPCQLPATPLNLVSRQDVAMIEGSSADGRSFAGLVREAARSWERHRETVCHERQLGTIEDHDYHRAVSCLRRRALSLQALTSLVAHTPGGPSTPARSAIRPLIVDPHCVTEPPIVVEGDTELGDAIDERIAAATMARLLGQPHQYLRMLEAIPNELGELSGAPGHALWLRVHLGQAHHALGELELAEATHRAVMLDAQRSPRPWPIVLGSAQAQLALVLAEQGKLDKARIFAELAVSAFESHPEGAPHLGLAWFVLSRIEYRAGDAQRTAEYLDRADASLLSAGVPGVGDLALERTVARALLAQERSDWDEGVRLFGEALAHFGWVFVDGRAVERGSDCASAGQLLHIAGVFEAKRGELDNAKLLLTTAIAIHEALDLRRQAADSHLSLANWTAAGDVEGALAHFDRAAELLSVLPDGPARYELEYDRAIALQYYTGDAAAAAAAYTRVIEAEPSISLALDVRYGAHVGRGMLRLELGAPEQARADFERALGLEQPQLANADKAELRLGLAQALSQTDDDEHEKIKATLADAHRFADLAGRVDLSDAIAKWTVGYDARP